MCGRVTISDQTSIAEGLHLKLADDLKRSGNINVPPSMELPLFTDEKPSDLQYFSWTLIPFWAKEKPKFSTFNARIENLHESGSWKHLIGKKHCVIITDGFYEWKKLDEKAKKKQPYLIRMKDMRFTLMAGLWDTWLDKKTGEIIHSCTIITRPANDDMKNLHDRMPCLLTIENANIWVNRVLSLADRMKALEVLSPNLLELKSVQKLGDEEEYKDLF
ncbi:SOS response-associated peptidase [Daejeonella sp.]|jgi:putative SOS response-associated peptidase YedK|uniref:SOS response-associated peptidase n=1 Tax=Daejeonella sp. TaxID=2805397 RepID=UPI0037BE5334